MQVALVLDDLLANGAPTGVALDLERLALDQILVADAAGGTSLEGSPIVPVSSVTGVDLDDLKKHLLEQAAHVRKREPNGPFRMAIDRVFAVQGRGTVVTGSVIRGVVTSGDTLELSDGGPSASKK